MIRGGIGMRRRCNGAPIKWLGGVVLIAIGLGMLLACLIPKCVFLIGMGFVGRGVIKKNGFYHSLGIRLRV